MNRRVVRTTARQGLRLRSSPLDGDTLLVLPQGTVLEVLANEDWLRVQSAEHGIGFVSAEYVEPVKDRANDSQADDS